MIATSTTRNETISMTTKTGKKTINQLTESQPPILLISRMSDTRAENVNNFNVTPVNSFCMLLLTIMSVN